jgi:hypothetical protein
MAMLAEHDLGAKPQVHWRDLVSSAHKHAFVRMTRGRKNVDWDPLCFFTLEVLVGGVSGSPKHAATARGKCTNDDAPRLVAMIGRSAVKDPKHGPAVV